MSGIENAKKPKKKAICESTNLNFLKNIFKMQKQNIRG
jgi:hypothetical protein